MDREKLVQEAFDLIRNSENLGRDSMSTFDECYTDAELLEDLREHCSDLTDKTTAKDVYEFYEMIEGVRLERDHEFDEEI